MLADDASITDTYAGAVPADLGYDALPVADDNSQPARVATAWRTLGGGHFRAEDRPLGSRCVAACPAESRAGWDRCSPSSDALLSGHWKD